jgi:hypothetical protein
LGVYEGATGALGYFAKNMEVDFLIQNGEFWNVAISKNAVNRGQIAFHGGQKHLIIVTSCVVAACWQYKSLGSYFEVCVGAHFERAERSRASCGRRCSSLKRATLAQVVAQNLQKSWRRISGRELGIDEARNGDRRTVEATLREVWWSARTPIRECQTSALSALNLLERPKVGRDQVV